VELFDLIESEHPATLAARPRIVTSPATHLS
jgi:hypothetical protein